MNSSTHVDPSSPFTSNTSTPPALYNLCIINLSGELYPNNVLLTQLQFSYWLQAPCLSDFHLPSPCSFPQQTSSLRSLPHLIANSL